MTNRKQRVFEERARQVLALHDALDLYRRYQNSGYAGAFDEWLNGYACHHFRIILFNPNRRTP